MSSFAEVIIETNNKERMIASQMRKRPLWEFAIMCDGMTESANVQIQWVVNICTQNVEVSIILDLESKLISLKTQTAKTSQIDNK